MKTFKEFIVEASNMHGIPDDKYVKWQQARERGEGPATMTFNGQRYAMRGKGVGADGKRRWAVSPVSDRKLSAAKRKQGAEFVDSDLTPEQKRRSAMKIAAITKAAKKGQVRDGSGKMQPGQRRGEHHHLTPLHQSAKEFAGLTPEQRREKREKDAKMGKYHGNDPRNIAFVRGKNTPTNRNAISHRGLGGYHSSQNKAVGSGGSISDYGSEAQIQRHRLRIQRHAEKLKRLKAERAAELRARMSVAAKASGFN